MPAPPPTPSANTFRLFASPFGWLFLVPSLWFGAVPGGQALRFLNISVPGMVPMGRAVWLRCDFDLEGEELYSVKWYKNHVEFYRYQPLDRPPGQEYRLLGTAVDLQRSNSSHVLLASIDLNSEGLYGCEVSGEAPFFSTAKSEDEMTVYALPTDDPEIRGLKPRYQVGDEVNITCTFGPSKPPAQLNWYINDDLALIHHVSHLPPRRTEEGLQWSESRLLFTMSGTYIKGGGLRLHCIAQIDINYAKAHDEIVIGERLSGPGPQNAPHVIPSKRRPRVSGDLNRYDVGDLVDVNCTSAKESGRPPILRWYINDREVPRAHLVEYTVMRDRAFLWRVLGLRFHVKQHHLRQGELRLRCESTLATAIVRRSEEVIFEGRHQTAELQVAQISSKDNSSERHVQRVWLLICVVVYHHFFMRSYN